MRTSRSSTRSSQSGLAESRSLAQALANIFRHAPHDENSMSESAAPATGMPKPKKSVALSGVVAGNTALCTVGRTGNDLHYRGYDILDIADVCEFEEIAHLLVHEKLPTTAELAAYKARLRNSRGIP